MGPLMNIQISAYAMTGAMQIVQAFAPHILSSQDINLGTAGSAWELTEFYLDMALEYKGVDLLLQTSRY